MFEKKLDKIRNRLSIDELDLLERQRLFDDLKKAGGQVVSFDEDPNPPSFHAKQHSLDNFVNDNQKKKRQQRALNNQIKAVKPKNPFREPVPISNSSPKKSKKFSNKKKHFGFLWVKLNSFIAGTTYLFTNKFKRKFINKTSKDVPQALITIKSVFHPLFSNNTAESMKFRMEMYQENRLYDYEMAYHMFYFLDLELFNNIESLLNKQISMSENRLKEIFKKLYVYNRWSAQLKVTALSMHKRIKQMTPEIPTEGAFEKAWDFIWFSYYYELENVIQLYLEIYSQENPYKPMEEFLEITEFPEMGKLAEEWKQLILIEQMKKEEAKNNKSDKEITPDDIYPNEYVKQGVEFILSKVDFIELYNKFQNGKDHRSTLNSEDKLFYLYALLDFFDSEFTLLWNGSIVTFYTISEGNQLGRFDPQKEIINVINKITGTYEMINDYIRACSTTASLKDPKMQNQRQKDLSKLSYQVRKYVETEFHNFLLILDKILKSSKTDDPLIGNWGEIIVLHKNYNGKIINGKTIVDTFKLIHQFIVAVLWLLKQGDLSGLSKEIASVVIFSDVKERIDQLEG